MERSQPDAGGLVVRFRVVMVVGYVGGLLGRFRVVRVVGCVGGLVHTALPRPPAPMLHAGPQLA